MKRFCPYCGNQIDSTSIYCLYCGKKIPEGARDPKKEEYWKPQTVYPTPPTTPYPSPPRPRYQQRAFHPTQQATLGDRCFALFIDNCISYSISVVSCLILCIPLGYAYDCIKDGIREGRSFGKGGMHLRVVDFRTGRPATIGQSMIRNCLCGSCDSSTCYCFAIMDSNGRRIGDKIAGTVVIKDY